MINQLNHLLEKGDRIQLVYCSNSGVFSKRAIRIFAVQQDYIRAYCYQRKQYRTFKMDNIFAWEFIDRAKGGGDHASA